MKLLLKQNVQEINKLLEMCKFSPAYLKYIVNVDTNTSYKLFQR